jgi:hypothetical protein
MVKSNKKSQRRQQKENEVLFMPQHISELQLLFHLPPIV